MAVTEKDGFKWTTVSLLCMIFLVCPTIFILPLYGKNSGDGTITRMLDITGVPIHLSPGLLYPSESCRKLDMDVLIFLDITSELPLQLFEDFVSSYTNSKDEVIGGIKFIVQTFGNECERHVTLVNQTGNDLVQSLTDLAAKSKTTRLVYKTKCDIVKIGTPHASPRYTTQVQGRVHSTIFIIDDFLFPVKDKDAFYKYLTRFMKSAKSTIAILYLGSESTVFPWTVLPRPFIIAYSGDNRIIMNSMEYLLCFMCPKGWKKSRVKQTASSDRPLPSCYYYGHSNITISSDEARIKCGYPLGGKLVSFTSSEEWTDQYNGIVAFALDEYNITSKPPSDDFNMSVHIGMNREPTRTVGWRLVWETGTLVHISRNNSIFDWTNAGRCIRAVFTECSKVARHCKRVIEESVACDAKNSHFYMCQMPFQLYDMHVEFRVTKNLATNDGKIMSNSRKCFISDDFYIFLPLFKKLPRHMECVKDEYIISTKVITDQTVINQIPMFDCRDSESNVVSFRSLCNRKYDCPNGMDEMIDCRFKSIDEPTGYRQRPCLPTEFTCLTFECIPLEAKCDLVMDCRDGSDEKHCDICRHYTCESGECVPKSVVRDGAQDCREIDHKSDENQEDTKEDRYGSECFMTCNETACISLNEVANNVTDCVRSKGADLKDAEMIPCNGMPSNIITWGPKCIFVQDRFDIVIGCRNYYHLENCERFKCPDDHYKCRYSGFCIPVSLIHNGNRDCPYGDDEGVNHLVFSAFMCHNTLIRQFISLDRVCDGKQDCFDNSDEEDCEHQCPDGLLCVGGAIVPLRDQAQNVRLYNLDFVSFLTVSLDFSGVDMNSSMHLFYQAHRFHSLIFLFMPKCNITELDPVTKGEAKLSSEDFRVLKILDLSRNSLTRIKPGSFLDNMKNLNRLNMSGNPSLKNPDIENALKDKSLMEVLDLSFTGLTTVPSHIRNMRDLRILHLSGCPIIKLRDGEFPHELFLLTLRSLPLSLFVKADFLRDLRKLDVLLVDRQMVCCEALLGHRVKPAVCQYTYATHVSSCRNLVNSLTLRPIMFLNALLGLILNMVALVYRLVHDRFYFETPQGLILTHLNVAGMLIPCNLFIIISADSRFRLHYATEEHAWTTSGVCQVAACIYRLGFVISSLIIAVLALERYLVVRYPFNRSIVKDMRIFAYLCLFSWVISFTIAVFSVNIANWTLHPSWGFCNSMPFFRPPYSLYDKSTDTPLFVFLVSDIWLFTETVLICLVFIALVTIYNIIYVERVPGQGSKIYPMDCFSKRLYNYEKRKVTRCMFVMVTSCVIWLITILFELAVFLGISENKTFAIWLAVAVIPLMSLMAPCFENTPRIIQMSKRQQSRSNPHRSRMTRERYSSIFENRLSNEATCSKNAVTKYFPELLHDVTQWVSQASSEDAVKLLNAIEYISGIKEGHHFGLLWREALGLYKDSLSPDMFYSAPNTPPMDNVVSTSVDPADPLGVRTSGLVAAESNDKMRFVERFQEDQSEDDSTKDMDDSDITKGRY